MSDPDNSNQTFMMKWKNNLIKFFSFNSKPTYESFPELVTILVWIRFALGVGYGISLGRSLQFGGIGILFGLNAIGLLPMAYCNLFLQADSDSYGSKLLLGGVPNSIALMVLIWIYYYTDHFSDVEKQMIAMLVNGSAPIGDDMTTQQLDAATTMDAADIAAATVNNGAASSSTTGGDAAADILQQQQQQQQAAMDHSYMDESEF